MSNRTNENFLYPLMSVETLRSIQEQLLGFVIDLTQNINHPNATNQDRTEVLTDLKGLIDEAVIIGWAIDEKEGN